MSSAKVAPPVRSASAHDPPHRKGPLRVVVVADRDASRNALCQALDADDGVRVVGRAGGGDEALKLTLELKPDCLCLALGMPPMDGFTLLRALKEFRPTPVVVVSAAARRDDAFRALELGALDFVSRPQRWDGSELPAFELDLRAKVAAVRALRLEDLRDGAEEGGAARPRRGHGVGRPRRVAVVGASTGGPGALMRLLCGLPDKLSLGIAVAQHMPGSFTRGFAERLARRTGLEVREAEQGDELLPGRVLLAPGGRNLRLVALRKRSEPLRAELEAPPRSAAYCPSVDVLFTSAAEAAGSAVCAVVLTGMGDDGARGVAAVKAAGGLTLAESEETAVVQAMPRAALETGLVDEVLGLDGLRARLCAFAEER